MSARVHRAQRRSADRRGACIRLSHRPGRVAGGIVSPAQQSSRNLYADGALFQRIASAERMSTPYKRFKQLLFGRPLASDRLEHEKLDKKTALAVLSSDAISSVAYATDQILLVLAVLGSAAFTYVVPISAVIVGLLVLVALSYRQTVFAYPHGGGSYTVAKDNLGQMAGLIAAASLLTDYILTVSVSISGGVAQIASAYPVLKPRTVEICLLVIF